MATTTDHRPLEVYTADGIPFVRCSCDENHHPQSALWLAEHFRGDVHDGVLALREVVAHQRAEAQR